MRPPPFFLTSKVMYRIKPKLHNKKLKRTRQREQYFILLPDQTCIIGREFEIMKKWKMRFRDKPIQDMFRTEKRINAGMTSLSKFIDENPDNWRK